MKKLIIALSAVLLLSVTALSVWSGNDLPSAMIPRGFDSVEQLAEEAETVVLCKAISDSTEFEYGDITFAKTDVSIKKVLRDIHGDIQNEDTITILQAKVKEDPLLKNGKDKMLFLKKYQGPVADNCYIIVGLHYGQFDYKDNKAYKVSNDDIIMNEKFIKNCTENSDLDKIHKILEVSKYKPKVVDEKAKIEDEQREETIRQQKPKSVDNQ